MAGGGMELLLRWLTSYISSFCYYNLYSSARYQPTRPPKLMLNSKINNQLIKDYSRLKPRLMLQNIQQIVLAYGLSKHDVMKVYVQSQYSFHDNFHNFDYG
jgi:hypothetical protein